MTTETIESTEEEILLPGKEFKIADKASVTVYPVGITQLKKFSTTIARLVGLIGTELKMKDGKKLDKGATVAIIMPHLLTSAIDLFEDCISVKGVVYDKIPHWHLPPMMEYWIIESFGERGKWEPWVKMVESLISRLTGEEVNLSDELSKLSSE